MIVKFSVLSTPLTIGKTMVDPARKAKIKWQCRRGMLELDLILCHFVERSLDNLTLNEFDALESLLSLSDPVLYSGLMGSDVITDKELVTIVHLIKLQDKTR